VPQALLCVASCFVVLHQIAALSRHRESSFCRASTSPLLGSTSTQNCRPAHDACATPIGVQEMMLSTHPIPALHHPSPTWKPDTLFFPSSATLRGAARSSPPAPPEKNLVSLYSFLQLYADQGGVNPQ
jgi:hypothetical protein